MLALYRVAEGEYNAAAMALPFLAAFVFLQAAAFSLRARFPNSSRFARHFLHLALYGIFYMQLHEMLSLSRPSTVDIALAGIDRTLFGTNPAAWLGTHGTPLLTDLLSISYFSYYFSMPLLLVLMWRGNTEHEFRRTLSAITIGWYGALLTYFLFPALGPQRCFPHELPVLHGYLPSTSFILGFLAQNLTPAVRDCVPSMHTAVTLLTLHAAFKYQRRFFWSYLPFGAGVIVATVYLQQHYAVDTLLGFAAFVLITAFVHASYSLFRPPTPRPQSRRKS